ncbi:MAG: ABC transporter ATP-binding protein [Peptostreptococcaceae bacterium]|nr:ABC transporter ATP-binding protein [Peptostreptococcaceae bacterium]
MAYLELKNITKSYNDDLTLKNIGLSIERGEFASLIGPSGVGKTTLFNILSGLELPDRGEILLDGADITGKTGAFSYMQQKDLLLPFYTMLDNICLPLRLKGMNRRDAHERAKAHLDEFGLGGSEEKYPAQLSGGMRQRGALLRAYLYSEKLMLLDEPFSALDSITKSNLHQWYREVSAKHDTTTFFITHDIDEALVLSDKIYVMTGPPGEIGEPLLLKDKGSDFALSVEFLEYKKHLIEKVKNR